MFTTSLFAGLKNSIVKVLALIGVDGNRPATEHDVLVICSVLAVIGIVSLCGLIYTCKLDKKFETR